MDIIGDVVYATVIGLLGFGVYRTIRRGLSKPARRIAVGLVTVAIVFSLAIVSWDIADGTSTSTDSFIVLIVGVPLLIALDKRDEIASLANAGQDTRRLMPERETPHLTARF